ncbi:hypothetical protein XPA_005388 [Xanthoria parietina]
MHHAPQEQTLEIHPAKDEARDRFGDSEEREAQTPPRNKTSMFIRVEAWPEFPLRDFGCPAHPVGYGSGPRKRANQPNCCGCIWEEEKERGARFGSRSQSGHDDGVNPARGGKKR